MITNNLEITKLKINEIKCPYCRFIQPKLLPYIKIPGNLTYYHGVTFPKKYRMDRIKCPCIIKSGKRKENNVGECDKADGYCSLHLKFMKNKKNIDENKKIGCNCILKSGKRKGKIVILKYLMTVSVNVTIIKE